MWPKVGLQRQMGRGRELLWSEYAPQKFIPTTVAQQCGSLGGGTHSEGLGWGALVFPSEFRICGSPATSLAKIPVSLSSRISQGTTCPSVFFYHKLKPHVALTRCSRWILDFPASRTMSQDKPFSLQITQSLVFCCGNRANEARHHGPEEGSLVFSMWECMSGVTIIFF